jgi:signal transduction histidine kinase
VLNLLSNAMKFTKRGGCVAIACRREPDRVAISVSDTGVGIPEDKLGIVFEPFIQVDPSLTRQRDGTGLGLAISRQLARGMGGELTAESTHGVGSTFTLTLPLAVVESIGISSSVTVNAAVLSHGAPPASRTAGSTRS